ncbi:response regulator [Belnapia moabensis]|uniref:response regulator n=1 Tax=Belnapia moabensis TaxID=365533 RepID=UPI00069400D0|nr:response regulator [Belnapia moabensis]
MNGLVGRRILLIEDDPLVSMDIEDLLLDVNASMVGPAQTTALALMLLSDERPDAAVLDMKLEGRSAMPVADALSSLGVPFIVLTADVKAGAQAANDIAPVLAKPCEPDKLIAALIGVLGRRGDGPVTASVG